MGLSPSWIPNAREDKIHKVTEIGLNQWFRFTIDALQLKQREELWKRKVEQAQALEDQKAAEERQQWAELRRTMEGQIDNLSSRLQVLQLESADSLKSTEQWVTLGHATQFLLSCQSA